MPQRVSHTFQARRALLRSLAPRNPQAPLVQKTHLLDSFVEGTGYSRKYAIALLNHEEYDQHTELDRFDGRATWMKFLEENGQKVELFLSALEAPSNRVKFTLHVFPFFKTTDLTFPEHDPYFISPARVRHAVSNEKKLIPTTALFVSICLALQANLQKPLLPVNPRAMSLSPGLSDISFKKLTKY